MTHALAAVSGPDRRFGRRDAGSGSATRRGRPRGDVTCGVPLHGCAAGGRPLRGSAACGFSLSGRLLGGHGVRSKGRTRRRGRRGPRTNGVGEREGNEKSITLDFGPDLRRDATGEVDRESHHVRAFVEGHDHPVHPRIRNGKHAGRTFAESRTRDLDTDRPAVGSEAGVVAEGTVEVHDDVRRRRRRGCTDTRDDRRFDARHHHQSAEKDRPAALERAAEPPADIHHLTSTTSAGWIMAPPWPPPQGARAGSGPPEGRGCPVRWPRGAPRSRRPRPRPSRGANEKG